MSTLSQTIVAQPHPSFSVTLKIIPDDPSSGTVHTSVLSHCPRTAYFCALNNSQANQPGISVTITHPPLYFLFYRNIIVGSTPMDVFNYVSRSGGPSDILFYELQTLCYSCPSNLHVAKFTPIPPSLPIYIYIPQRLSHLLSLLFICNQCHSNTGSGYFRSTWSTSGPRGSSFEDGHNNLDCTHSCPFSYVTLIIIPL